MMEKDMTYGARKGAWHFLKRWTAKATASDLSIFPVPGADVLRACGMHFMQKGMSVAATPRQANVLLVAGPITEKLAEKAAVAYAQMPRPRVLVFAGPDKLPYLPAPDLKVAIGAENIQQEIKKLLAQHAWRKDIIPFVPENIKKALEDQQEGQGHMHHSQEEEHDHHQHEEPGNKEEHEDHEQAQADEHEGHQHESQSSHHQHTSSSPHQHDMSGGFMSMVAMTKDMPRSMDGLPMEMNQTHFGPFFPGLPGGLSIAMMLDGDTVMQAEIEKKLLCRNLYNDYPSAPAAFIEHISSINPLAPVTFRLLAERAIRQVMEIETDRGHHVSDLILLEQERVLCHLNWLAVFAHTIGNLWMQQKAADLHRQYQYGQANGQAITKFTTQISKMLHLKKRLMPVGVVPENLLHHASGPVARAVGLPKDARMQDESYQELGFSPVLEQQNNAWGRLLVRLAEIRQSLQLIEKSSKTANTKQQQPAMADNTSGKGTAQIETSTGTALLTVHLEEGSVKDFHLQTPAIAYAALVPQVAAMQELGDVLIIIASLDIAAWEIDV